MTTLHAQPYDISATGFYFTDLESYDAAYAANVNDYGQPVEEYEIQLIEADATDCAIAWAMQLNQANLAQFFGYIDQAPDEHDVIAFCIALGDNIATLSKDTAIDEFTDNMIIYRADTMKELAEQFIDEGMLGDIPDHLQNYIDVEAYAWDLSHDYTEANVLGLNVFYQAG
jgi:antirestriction protein